MQQHRSQRAGFQLLQLRVAGFQFEERVAPFDVFLSSGLLYLRRKALGFVGRQISGCDWEPV